MRDPALALIISRAVAPASKPANLTAWDDVTLGADLAVAGAGTDEVYARPGSPAGPPGRDREEFRGQVSGAGGEPVTDGHLCLTCPTSLHRFRGGGQWVEGPRGIRVGGRRSPLVGSAGRSSGGLSCLT